VGRRKEEASGTFEYPPLSFVDRHGELWAFFDVFGLMMTKQR
jgi:hypothetical protein